MRTEQAMLCIIKKPKAFKIATDANVVRVMTLVINMCLSALMTAQPPFFFFFHGTKSEWEKEMMGASGGDKDGHNHPKENRQHWSLHYRFRLWYEPERESGGFYIKPRPLLPHLTFAVICVIARSVWMKSSSCLYYRCPFGRAQTKRFSPCKL